MEIFTFMFSKSDAVSWTGAGFAVIVVAGLYKVLENYKHTKELLTITRYSFLVFAMWFGYEALEHAHIL